MPMTVPMTAPRNPNRRFRGETATEKPRNNPANASTGLLLVQEVADDPEGKRHLQPGDERQVRDHRQPGGDEECDGPSPVAEDANRRQKEQTDGDREAERFEQGPVSQQ